MPWTENVTCIVGEVEWRGMLGNRIQFRIAGVQVWSEGTLHGLWKENS